MRSIPSSPRIGRPRRGMTLVEMMVVVALVVLMMSILVSIFSSATGAISSSRVFVELDSGLRNLDSTIRRDLAGVTARLTPPLDPKDNLGYFEYSENSFADAQGEDGDDTLSFTAKAPEGQKFTGRFYIHYLVKPGQDPVNSAGVLNTAGLTTNFSTQPTLISSDYAEIIYFLRNGNLYRRVLLIVPEKQSSVVTAITTPAGPQTLSIGQFALPGVSWQGANDVSARPSMSSGQLEPTLNSLGDLTNRQNRFARPRFCNDYYNPIGGTTSGVPDGIPDDGNEDGLPDYYPTMYPAMIKNLAVGLLNWDAFPPSPQQLYPLRVTSASWESVFAFPYIYPASFSKPDTTTGSSGVALDKLGWIRSAIVDGRINQCPLEQGDNLIVSPIASLPASNYQSWWGYPTWRETMSPKWADPYYKINYQNTFALGVQAPGIQPIAQTGTTLYPSTWATNNMLPPINPLINTAGGGAAIWANNITPVMSGSLPAFTDNAGYSGVGVGLTRPFRPTGGPDSTLNPNMVWEDDLILTGVRSFDVKAYDPAFAGYQDLGWGSNVDGIFSDSLPYDTISPPTGNLGGPRLSKDHYFVDLTPYRLAWRDNRVWDTLNQTFAHEGRIPPLPSDGRFNASTKIHPLGDSSDGVIRLRRVWDTWSTEYTNAPNTDIRGKGYNPPTSTGLPIYPSFPPPYPAPLRGIQINVRLVDPNNEKVRSLTITQDFTDKL
jgi:prepilin-type N-terminal cleavage/methylation domain-containing protein